MALNRVDLGIQYFPQFAADRAIANAQIYIGLPNLDPAVLANQIQAYVVQENGTQVAVPQPIRTSAGGVPTYNGSPVEIAVNELQYSLKILSSTGSQIYYKSIVNGSLTPANSTINLEDYTALRAYVGIANTVYITGVLVTAQPQGIAGVFQYDETDVTSADNGGTIIVGADGRRWKRVFEGEASIEFFGADLAASASVNYNAVQNALNAENAVVIPDKTYQISDNEIVVGSNKKLFGLGKSSQLISASTTYAIRMVGQTSEVKNFFLGCAANGIYLDTATNNCVFNQIDDMYINGPGRGVASTTNSFVGVHFANQNGSLSCYFNWVTKNRVRNFNTLFLLDAPVGNSSLGANANQLIDNIGEFYWVAYKIRAIENTIRGGFFNQAGGASSVDPSIGYLLENSCSRNTIECAQGEPGVNAIGYKVEVGCVNNYIHMPSSNFDLGNIKQPNNSYNEEIFQSFTYSNLVENTYYTIALAGAIGTNNSYQHFQLEYSSSNAVINAQYHGRAEFVLSRAGATVSANVIENKRLSIGSCVYFVGIFIDGSNIPNMVFLHRNNGSASTAGILNLRLRSIGRSLNFVLANTVVSNGAVNPTNYGGRFGSATYNPPSIAAGASVTTTVSCPGAALGDTVQVAFGVDQQGLILSGYVSAVDTVTVVFFNPTAGAVDLASSLLRVRTEPLPFL